MKELSLSFGHFKREDELPLTIIVNGCTYQSQPLVDATKKTYFEMGKREATFEKVDQFNKGYEIGKYEGYEAGKKSNGYTADDIKKLHTYAKGKEEGYRDGYNDGYEQCKHDGITNKEDYDKGYKVGYEAGKVDNPSYMRVYASRIEEARKRGYEAGKSAGYDEGYEQCKHDGISKINLNTESVEQTELSKEYDKGFTKGYEEGKSEGYKVGYEAGRNRWF